MARPVQGDAPRLGITLAALGTLLALVAAVLAGLAAPWWAWTSYLIWGALWVTAALGLGDAASRAFLSGTLRKSTYTQIYTTLTRRLLTPLWTRLCDPAPEKAPWPTQFRAALTWRLYDRALLIAVAYPILLLIGQWVWTGNDGRVANFAVLPALPFWPGRVIALLIFAIIFTSIFVGDRLAPQAIRHSAVARGQAMGVPLLVAFVLAITFLGAGIDAFGFLGAIAGTLAGVVLFFAGFSGPSAVLFAFGFASILTFSGTVEITDKVMGLPARFSVSAPYFLIAVLAIFGSITVVVAANVLHVAGWKKAARYALTASIIGSAVLIAIWPDWSTVPENRRTLFLFLAVLPLLNALFDVISYAATLSLTRRGLQSRLPLLWGLADLALACVLFLALGATLVAAIHALNLLAGVPFLDLPALFDGAAPPSWAYFWLYAMLFSTILPTALHAALSLLGLQGIWPRPLRRHVASWIDTAHTPLTSARASLALGLIWTLPVLTIMAIVAALWWVSADTISWILQRYLDALIWIATQSLAAL